jgi:rubrerythrin
MTDEYDYKPECEYEYFGDDAERSAVFICKYCGHQAFVAGDGCPSRRVCSAPKKHPKREEKQ